MVLLADVITYFIPYHYPSALDRQRNLAYRLLPMLQLKKCRQPSVTSMDVTTDLVRAGEVVMSACAMDEQTMKELYEYNVNFTNEDLGPTPNKQKAEAPQSWAGSTVRLMLQLMFVTVMLLLLWFEEILCIMWSDVQFKYYQPQWG
ncbi:hypothetical protein EDD22DRAFT_850028 [Suillus occidentalis]|nr:hypothetical protein EDD22DRAFT_850028 [Suillus occidentalis]